MFWYGAQTYFASTAVALLIRALSGSDGGGDTFLGMDGIDWISFIFVAGFQIYLFWQGIDLIRKFLNFAGPAVYAVMIILMLTIWYPSLSGLGGYAWIIGAALGTVLHLMMSGKKTRR